jgi:hypothetical protein
MLVGLGLVAQTTVVLCPEVMETVTAAVEAVAVLIMVQVEMGAIVVRLVALAAVAVEMTVQIFRAESSEGEGVIQRGLMDKRSMMLMVVTVEVHTVETQE